MRPKQTYGIRFGDYLVPCPSTNGKLIGRKGDTCHASMALLMALLAQSPQLLWSDKTCSVEMQCWSLPFGHFDGNW